MLQAFIFGALLASVGCSSGGASSPGKDAGGIDATPLTLPGCVLDLLSTCPVTAPCYSSSNNGQLSKLCFAAATDAGAEVSASVGPAPPPTSGTADCWSQLVTVVKADGSPCYSFEQHETSLSDCQEFTWTWKDASGQLVATGRRRHDEATASVTCASGGASTGCAEPYPGSCCDVSLYGSVACPDGVNVAACTPGVCY